MDGKMFLGVLCACAGLAACGGGGGGVVAPIVPTIGLLDSALPFGATNGNPQDMLAANLAGITTTDAKITFNADGSFSVTLPGGVPTVTVDNTAIITDAPAFDSELQTTSATMNIGDFIVDLHLGEDVVGSDLFLLARIEDGFSPNDLVFTVFGDEAATLPAGGATYTGGFVSDAFDSNGDPVAIPQLSGTTSIIADFDGGTVGLTFTVVGDGAGTVFTGASTSITGAQYSGTIASTAGGMNYSGNFTGAFYGPGAEGTAGVFNALDIGAGATGGDLEIIGGFTGRQ